VAALACTSGNTAGIEIIVGGRAGAGGP